MLTETTPAALQSTSLQHQMMRIGGMITVLMGSNSINPETVVTQSGGMITSEQMDQIMLGRHPGLTLAQFEYLSKAFGVTFSIGVSVPPSPTPTA